MEPTYSRGGRKVRRERREAAAVEGEEGLGIVGIFVVAGTLRPWWISFFLDNGEKVPAFTSMKKLRPPNTEYHTPMKSISITRTDRAKRNIITSSHAKNN
jgi:hypothetical protein